MEPDTLTEFYTSNWIGATSYKIAPITNWNDGITSIPPQNKSVNTTALFSPSANWNGNIKQNPIIMQNSNFYGSAPYIGVYNGVDEF